MSDLVVSLALLFWLAGIVLYLLIVVFVIVIILRLPGHMRRQEERTYRIEKHAEKAVQYLAHLDDLPSRLINAKQHADRESARTKREAEDMEFVAWREGSR